MGNRETVGIAAIAVGVLIVIASVRGTLGKLWSDVVLGQKSTPQASSGSFPNNPNATTMSTPTGFQGVQLGVFPGTAGSPTLPTQ